MLDLSKIPMIQAKTHNPRAHPPTHIVIHAMGGFFLPSIDMFRRGPNSAHYCISKKGEVVCCVKPEERGQHVVNFNTPAIGIEHEDGSQEKGKVLKTCLNDSKWMTDAEFNTSVQLTAALMKKFAIPIEHVIGHNDPMLRKLGNNHADPGPYFPWERYRAAIKKELQNG